MALPRLHDFIFGVVAQTQRAQPTPSHNPNDVLEHLQIYYQKYRAACKGSVSIPEDVLGFILPSYAAACDSTMAMYSCGSMAEAGRIRHTFVTSINDRAKAILESGLRSQHWNRYHDHKMGLLRYETEHRCIDPSHTKGVATFLSLFGITGQGIHAPLFRVVLPGKVRGRLGLGGSRADPDLPVLRKIFAICRLGPSHGDVVSLSSSVAPRSTLCALNVKGDRSVVFLYTEGLEHLASEVYNRLVRLHVISEAGDVLCDKDSILGGSRELDHSTYPFNHAGVAIVLDVVPTQKLRNTANCLIKSLPRRFPILYDPRIKMGTLRYGRTQQPRLVYHLLDRTHGPPLPSSGEGVEEQECQAPSSAPLAPSTLQIGRIAKQIGIAPPTADDGAASLTEAEVQFCTTRSSCLAIGRAGSGKSASLVLRLMADRETASRPLFVSLSLNLVAEVRKVVRGDALPDQRAILSLPNNLSDLSPEAFPLFLTIDKLLLMLDGTGSAPFFQPAPSTVTIGQGEGDGDGESGSADGWGDAADAERVWNVGGLPTTRHSYSVHPRTGEVQDHEVWHRAGHSDFLSAYPSIVRSVLAQVKGGRVPTPNAALLTAYAQAQKAAGRGGKQPLHPRDLRGANRDAVLQWIPEFGLSYQAALDAIPGADVAYQEIVTHITGSFPCASQGAPLSLRQYLQMGTGQSLLSTQARYLCHLIHTHWAAHKQAARLYERADVVLHVVRALHQGAISSAQYRSRAAIPIDSVYIDECQDLTAAYVYMLFRMCPAAARSFYMVGDTAQTISRGVGFRFADLRTAFYHTLQRETLLAERHSSVPDLLHFSVNFRATRSIVRLSSALSLSLAKQFPNSVDALPRETVYKGPGSHKGKGEVPRLLIGDPDSLFRLVCGGGGGGSGRIEFGAKQLVVVRSDTDAKRPFVSGLAGHGLWLTVLDCKGLEADDVLVVGFFSSAECVLSSCDSHSPSSSADEASDIGTDTASASASASASISRNLALASELKHLYVAVTRARKRLWFVEPESSRSDVMGKRAVQRLIAKGLLQLTDVDSVGGGDAAFGRASTTEEWGDRAKELMAKGYYQAALRASAYAADPLLTTLCKAYVTASQADGAAVQERPSLFCEAGSLFSKASESRLSAQCYVSGGMYQRAGHMFETAAGAVVGGVGARPSTVSRASEWDSLLSSAEYAYRRGGMYLEAAEIAGDRRGDHTGALDHCCAAVRACIRGGEPCSAGTPVAEAIVRHSASVLASDTVDVESRHALLRGAVHIGLYAAGASPSERENLRQSVRTAVQASTVDVDATLAPTFLSLSSTCTDSAERASVLGALVLLTTCSAVTASRYTHLLPHSGVSAMMSSKEAKGVSTTDTPQQERVPITSVLDSASDTLTGGNSFLSHPLTSAAGCGLTRVSVGDDTSDARTPFAQLCRLSAATIPVRSLGAKGPLGRKGARTRTSVGDIVAGGLTLALSAIKGPVSMSLSVGDITALARSLSRLLTSLTECNPPLHTQCDGMLYSSLVSHLVRALLCLWCHVYTLGEDDVTDDLRLALSPSLRPSASDPAMCRLLGGMGSGVSTRDKNTSEAYAVRRSLRGVLEGVSIVSACASARHTLSPSPSPEGSDSDWGVLQTALQSMSRNGLPLLSLAVSRLPTRRVEGEEEPNLTADTAVVVELEGYRQRGEAVPSSTQALLSTSVSDLSLSVDTPLHPGLSLCSTHTLCAALSMPPLELRAKAWDVVDAYLAWDGTPTLADTLTRGVDAIVERELEADRVLREQRERERAHTLRLQKAKRVRYAQAKQAKAQMRKMRGRARK
ncbi:hypothetical protein KIPB_003780 [Kipferlia bialata]|uniref:UvrD-like helicase ATP-binding domain-containing protein n=1 Tax=Kipferlia bialata TaxID=797122 RepID=A0A9K3CSP6_9EUKA|nr:hypothetical protein KIPB_003780 [Kipferlia bialata]|eukprot:g3780.t1